MIEKNVRITIDLKYTIHGLADVAFNEGTDAQTREELLRDSRLLDGVLNDKKALEAMLTQSAVTLLAESTDRQEVYEQIGIEGSEERILSRVIKGLDEKDKAFFQKVLENDCLLSEATAIGEIFLNPDSVKYNIDIT